MSRVFWCVDVEGNGATPPEIVELAMVEWSIPGRLDRHFLWLIKPEKPISKVVSKIHGITDEDVERAPTAEDINDDVLQWLNDRPIIGHNVKVEVEVLRRAFPDWQPTGAIDTLALAKRLEPGQSSYALNSLGQAFGLAEKAAFLTGKTHHSALYDATLAGLLFTFLLSDKSEVDRENAILEADILNSCQGQLL